MIQKRKKRRERHKRIRKIISGTKSRPRLSVFRSSSHIYAQLIDDEKGITVASASSKEVKERKSKEEKGNQNPKVQKARELGKIIAQKGILKGVKLVVFDRSGYRYQGRVKALAEGAREGGLKF